MLQRSLRTTSYGVLDVVVVVVVVVVNGGYAETAERVSYFLQCSDGQHYSSARQDSYANNGSWSVRLTICCST